MKFKFKVQNNLLYSNKYFRKYPCVLMYASKEYLCLLTQVPSSPPPLTAPIARRLSISASVAGEEGFLSCVLPEELLVEILADRLQVGKNELLF